MSDVPLIELRVPVDPASVSVVRTSVASLAARFDFTLDRLDDLRLATNEACALLLALGEPAGPTLIASVESPGEDTLRVDLCRAGSSTRLPGEESFAWTVLHALVDSVEVRDADDMVHLVLTASANAVEPA